jgi:hypothetical protein
MGVKAIAEKLQDNLQALAPIATPTVYYFDHVWIGIPEKIPMGDKHVVTIVASSNPDFFYTSCATATMKDTDFEITIWSKGSVEKATLATYDMTDIVLTSLYADDTIGGTCLGSTIENVVYDNEGFRSGTNMIMGARITLRCRN